MDDSRIHRRTRARPYDLRRKVLLKNFLKDQMTHIPITPTVSFSTCESSSKESPSSDEESEINEQTSSSAVVEEINHSISSSSDDDNNIKYNRENEIDLAKEIDAVAIDKTDITPVNSNFSHSPSLVKFTGLFKKGSKSSSKPSFKPKKASKNIKSTMKTRSFKKSFDKVFYGHKKQDEKLSSNQVPKNSTRSLFSLFKQRREQRHAKDTDRVMRSSVNHFPHNVPTKSVTVNQSVQTDDSWVKKEITKVHQSNKRLKEENKLLSESLSYFMSNTSVDPQLRQRSPQFQSSNENTLMFHDYSIPPSRSNQDSWTSRSKVSRSNSARECNERQKVLRNSYRTKSMNAHNSRNYFLANSRPLLPTYTDVANVPRLRRKVALPVTPNSISSRIIQRHSSMPERRLSENNRLVPCGRSNSMRIAHIRKPFYALSADAFY